MKLQRLSANKPDFTKLDKMIASMNGLLEGSQKPTLTIEELCSFQDDDGSFKLLDSYQVPGDARVDYCYTPTYIGAAILMKTHLDEKECFAAELKKALKASLKGGLLGHGYEAEKGRISAMKIFIRGGLR
mgnify:CR=1 FL=1